MARVSKRPLAVVAWGLGILVMAAPTVIALRLTSSKFGAPSADGTAAPVAEAPQSSPAQFSPHSSPPQVSVPSHSVHVNAPIESWGHAFHGHTYDIPRQLHDGRSFEPAAVIGPHAVVGTVQAGTGSGNTVYGVVVIDPVTAEVTATIATGTNATSDMAARRDQSDVVSASGANADWVSWLHGHRGDGNGFDRATIYAQNLKTGRRLVLGTATTGDSQQLTPTVSGDDVMWADPSAVHVYSLSKRVSVYTLSLTDTTSTSTHADAFHWPWLSYQVRPLADGPSVSHLVDVRSAADHVVSGPCDGTWCATTAGADAADAVGLVAQGIASESRTIASNLGGFGGVAGLSNGFVLWTDTDPYVPGSGRNPDASAPPASALHTYLYDIATDRDIEMPASRTSFISGTYVVWEDPPSNANAGGVVHFAALAEIS
jgi:hypothetical protein